MQMPILNIIISFLLFFQFSLGNLDILYDLSNIPQTNELHSIKSCGEEGRGCQLIEFWFYKKCWCPPKPKDKLTPKRGTLLTDKAKSLLGYDPKWTLDKGYPKYIEWYKIFVNTK